MVKNHSKWEEGQPLPAVMFISEVAAFLRTTEAQIRLMVKRQQIKPVRGFAKPLRFSVSEVRRIEQGG